MYQICVYSIFWFLYLRVLQIDIVIRDTTLLREEVKREKRERESEGRREGGGEREGEGGRGRERGRETAMIKDAGQKTCM